MPRFYDESEAQAQARDRWQAEYEASGYARMHNVHQGYVASNPEGVLRGQYDNTGGEPEDQRRGRGRLVSPDPGVLRRRGGVVSGGRQRFLHFGAISHK